MSEIKDLDEKESEKTKIDYSRAFSYVFKDPHWVKKLMVGGLIFISCYPFFLIPYLFIEGYIIRIIRRVAAGEDEGLPEWDNWGELFRTGFKLGVIRFVYNLPFMLLIGSYAALPLLLASAFQLEEEAAAIFPLLMMPFQALSMLLGIVLGLWMLSVEIRFAQEIRIKSCFRFKELYRSIKEDFKDYFVIFLILMGVNYLSSVGMIIFIIGMFFTLMYALFVRSHLEGQLLRRKMKKTGTGLTVIEQDKARDRKWLIAAIVIIICIALICTLTISGLTGLLIYRSTTGNQVIKEVKESNVHLKRSIDINEAAYRERGYVLSKSGSFYLADREQNLKRKQAYKVFASQMHKSYNEDTEALDDMKKIGRLKISRNYRRYLELEIKKVELQRKIEKIEERRAIVAVKAYQAKLDGNEDLADKLYYQALDLSKERYRYWKKAFEKDQEASEMFKRHLNEFWLLYQCHCGFDLSITPPSSSLKWGEYI